MFPLVRANRDEICARLGIIIFLQPDGTPVVEIVGVIVGRVHGKQYLQVGAYGNTPRWPYGHTAIYPDGHIRLRPYALTGSISDSSIVAIRFTNMLRKHLLYPPLIRWFGK